MAQINYIVKCPNCDADMKADNLPLKRNSSAIAVATSTATIETSGAEINISKDNIGHLTQLLCPKCGNTIQKILRS